MQKKILLTLIILITSLNVYAKELLYQGKVKGMVCAFCVYSVSKKISQIPGVIPASVNVELASGLVSFKSTTNISYKKVSALFADSGFKLIALKQVRQSTLKTPLYEDAPAFVLTLKNTDIKTYGPVIEPVGNIAAARSGKIVITAPASAEIPLLRTMIGGKQKTIRIQYIKTADKVIQIKLFPVKQ